MARISTLDQLVALYPSPSERVRTKKQAAFDEGTRGLVESSTFVLLATADTEGRCDVSPRGGPAGFVKVLDDRHVAIPDLNGNHLIDSLRNIVVNPHAGLLVLVPGQDETLRVDGTAVVTTDDDVLDRFVDELRRPRVAIVLEVEHVFTHCAKAFRRGGVWRPDTWPAFDRSPFLAARHGQLVRDGLTDDAIDDYISTNSCKIDDDLAADAPTVD
ncbi:MAG: MSMEG_1061 family FMN-dependent PPOX-type flavoprotein [Acidimicrobiales bacterium]